MEIVKGDEGCNFLLVGLQTAINEYAGNMELYADPETIKETPRHSTARTLTLYVSGNSGNSQVWKGTMKEHGCTKEGAMAILDQRFGLLVSFIESQYGRFKYVFVCSDEMFARLEPEHHEVIARRMKISKGVGGCIVLDERPFWQNQGVLPGGRRMASGRFE